MSTDITFSEGSAGSLGAFVSGVGESVSVISCAVSSGCGSLSVLDELLSASGEVEGDSVSSSSADFWCGASRKAPPFMPKRGL